MAEQPTAGSDRPADRHRTRAELRERREAKRRAIRRRRRNAGLLVAALVALVVVAAIGIGGGAGGDNGRADPKGAASGSHSGGPGEAAALAISGPARNSSPQPDWQPHPGPVPILEWHVLGDPPPEAPYPELYVSRAGFREQIEWLDREGYEAVTLEQVEEAWWNGATLPPKPVVLSFDDGYRPDYTFAMPLLHEHGWAGVLNLQVDGSGLYPSNVEAMIDAGWELASHTIDHLDLTGLDAEGMRRELEGSRAILRRDYGVPVRNFCYPAGSYDEAVIDAVRDAGYEAAMTQEREPARPARPYELGRFSVLRSSGLDGVAGALESG
jgi:peptidoglycan/xylan/chitin deacetylase (PgdA/CDA1 family)